MMKKLIYPLALLVFLASSQSYARFMPEDFKIKKDADTVLEEGDC
jgi:hypothetical protein